MATTVLIDSPKGLISTTNASTTPLAGAATFTGTAEQNFFPDVMASVYADVAGTMYFDYSIDGTNWRTFPIAGFAVAAGVHAFHTGIKGPRYFRVRYINGAAAQATFQLKAYFGQFEVVRDGGETARIAPLHVQQMPIKGNSYRAGMFTGTIGAALAAGSELFQFRFVSGTKSYALVHSVSFDGAGIVAVGTAIGPLGWYLTPARAWTVAGSGGNRYANTGDNMQLETGLPVSQTSDIGIATTGALTAGTKTLDTMSMGTVLTGTLTGAATVQQIGQLAAPAFLFDSSKNGGMPLVLANEEGFVIRTTHAGPAALTYVAGFSVSWTEVTAF